MSTTITWSISQLDVKPQENGFENVIVTAHWECVGTQDQYSGRVYSTCSFTPPSEGSEDFVSYDSLTKEQVLGWIWSNGVDKEATESAVQSQIDSQINPPITHPPLPWS